MRVFHAFVGAQACEQLVLSRLVWTKSTPAWRFILAAAVDKLPCRILLWGLHFWQSQRTGILFFGAIRWPRVGYFGNAYMIIGGTTRRMQMRVYLNGEPVPRHRFVHTGISSSTVSVVGKTVYTHDTQARWPRDFVLRTLYCADI